MWRETTKGEIGRVLLSLDVWKLEHVFLGCLWTMLQYMAVLVTFTVDVIVVFCSAVIVVVISGYVVVHMLCIGIKKEHIITSISIS